MTATANAVSEPALDFIGEALQVIEVSNQTPAGVLKGDTKVWFEALPLNYTIPTYFQNTGKITIVSHGQTYEICFKAGSPARCNENPLLKE